MTMRWLKEHGVISNHEDYLALPVGVLEDAELLAEYEALQAKAEKAMANGRHG